MRYFDLGQLRQCLRDLAFQPGQVKCAELGGSPDTPFEQAFSNLAHSYLKDKVPKLLDYEIGFQLIEKNNENTKAVGVFGFKVGNQWLYAPVFFLNGDLKGHELLYIKQQDMFVPLKEEWINYLLGKKPSILGEGLNRNLSLVGVMPPNLYQLSRSPNKFASVMPRLAGWAQTVLPDLAYFATQDPTTEPKYASLKGLPDFLKEAGADVFRHLVQDIGSSYPAVLHAVDRFYGPDMLTGVARMLAAREKQASSILNKDAGMSCGSGMRMSRPRPPKKAKKGKAVKHASILTKVAKSPKGYSSKVKITTMDQVNSGNQADLLHDLDADDRQVLLKERVVIKDKRDDHEVTLAYSVQTQTKLWNPDRTNVYNVLVKPSDFERCLILFSPYDEKGTNTFCTVVRLSDKTWKNIHPSKVWVESELDDEAFREWFEKLPEAKSLPKDDELYLLLTPWGDGTCPCKVTESYGSDDDKTKLYDVHFEDYASDHGLPFYQHHRHLERTERDQLWCGSRIRLTGHPGKRIHVVEGDVSIPLGTRYLELKDIYKPAKKESVELLQHPDGSEKSPFQLGNLLDVQLALASCTMPLKLYADGRNVTFDEAKKLNKVAALCHLVTAYGLREKTARFLLAEAEREGRVHGRAFRCLLKQAAPGPIGDMVSGAPNAPPFPEPNIGWDPMTGSNVPTMTQSEFNVRVPDLSASRTDRSIYQPQLPDPKSMSVAQHAAQTGQHEVFDTAMLGSLLKAVRQDSMVDRYRGDLMKGMDRLGRILFLFYWHGEEFEDRYGKQDMPELEDGLRNAFEGIGDIILALQRKSVDPYPDEGTDVDLSAVANQ